MHTSKRLARFMLMLAFIVTAGFWALADDPTGTSDPDREPRVLRIRIPTDIKNMDPAHWFSRYDQIVGSPLLSGLIAYEPGSYETRLDLAESLEVSEDGTQLHFRLKEGVMCHKGNGELTAADVKFSYERFHDPDLPSPYGDDWQVLDRVDVTGRYEGTIVLSAPFAPLWHTTLPMMAGADIVATGPYYLDRWEPDRQVVLKRNTEYFGEQPYYDEIRFIVIKDEQSAEIALESGEVDFGEVQLSSLMLFERNPSLETVLRPSLSYRWIGLNAEHPKLADRRVREAIRLAIDVPSILIVAYEGQAEQSGAIIGEGITGYWEDAPLHARDVEKARALLAEAGVESLALRLDTADTPEYRAWAEIAQQNLRDVGIDLEINPMDTGSYWEIGGGDEGKNVELFTMSFSMQPDPSWATMWFTCDQIGIWNWMRWCNEEFDALHVRGLQATDDAERQRIYEEMQRLMDEDAVAIWITHGTVAYAHAPEVVPSLSPHGLVEAEHFERR